MAMELPAVPMGSGKHPIALVVLSAKQLAASSAFYQKLFGWQLMPMTAEMTAVVTPAGPSCALRSDFPEGSPGMVPYIGVANVDATLKEVVATGAEVAKAPWKVPAVGTLARFKDTGGTIYGITDAMTPNGAPHIPMPLGAGPKPPAGAICSLEMYAADSAVASRLFTALFGWGTIVTMPNYMAFDPGAGVGGVWQSHTPSLPALTYLYATDVSAKLTEIDAAGGKRLSEPMALPGIATFGYFSDPSGTSMGLIGP
jgi:hypothetical protein